MLLVAVVSGHVPLRAAGEVNWSVFNCENFFRVIRGVQLTPVSFFIYFYIKRIVLLVVKVRVCLLTSSSSSEYLKIEGFMS